MKDQLSAKVFNFGLFLEGLKRLRVIGVATAIISLCFSALIPIVSWMQETGSQIWEIYAHLVCTPLYFTVLIAPFFVLTMFSFLHERKEADFFHAIPYTRTCVYISFLAAALALIFAIQIASASVAGILWGIHPTAVYDFGAYIDIVLTGMLSAAMLAGFMAVAVTLTGTRLTTVLVFGIFCLFTRLVALYMSTTISENIDVLASLPMHYLRFDWFLPFGYLASGLGIYGSSGGINHFSQVFNPLLDPACIIYSIVITLLTFALGWLFYVKRKSEMAGNTASSRVTQHIFRCLFTMPLALLIPVFALNDKNVDMSTLFVLLVITLVTYYLYELITTKRVKNLVSATPWLLVLLGGILLFTGVYYTVEGVVLNTPIRTEDVAYVSLKGDISSYDNYQKHLLYKSGTADEDIIEQICDAYAITQQCDKADDYSDHFNTDQYEYGYTNWIVHTTVNFKMKNGQSITRTVCFSRKETESLYKTYYQSVDIDDTLWDIPDKIDRFHRISGTYGTFYYGRKNECQMTLPAHRCKALYAVIYEEYMALPIEEKQQIRAEYSSLQKIINSDVAEHACVKIVFRSGDSNYSISIYIDERMPKSLAALKQYAHSFPEDVVMDKAAP